MLCNVGITHCSFSVVCSVTAVVIVYSVLHSCEYVIFFNCIVYSLLKKEWENSTFPKCSFYFYR